MKKSTRYHAPIFMSASFDLIQAGRFSGQLFQHDRSDLRSHRIVPKTGDALKRLLADDRRSHSRMPASHVITFLALPEQGSNSVELFTAELQNICESGVCLTTDSRLKPGQLLQFCERPFYRRGIVKWVSVGEAGDCYKAGIEFIDCGQGEANCPQGKGDTIIIA